MRSITIHRIVLLLEALFVLLPVTLLAIVGSSWMLRLSGSR